MGEQPPKKDNNDPVDPDTLADDFDEKAALHSNDAVSGGNQDQELDEKAALHQEHQDELDALLSDSSPPTSRYIAHAL